MTWRWLIGGYDEDDPDTPEWNTWKEVDSFKAARERILPALLYLAHESVGLPSERSDALRAAVDLVLCPLDVWRWSAQVGGDDYRIERLP